MAVRARSRNESAPALMKLDDDGGGVASPGSSLHRLSGGLAVDGSSPRSKAADEQLHSLGAQHVCMLN